MSKKLLTPALVALLLKPVPLKGVDKRFLYAGIGISFALSLTFSSIS